MLSPSDSAPDPASPAPVQDPAPSAPREQVPWPPWTAPGALFLGFGLGAVSSVLVAVAAAAGGSSLSHPTPAVSIVSDVVFDLSFVAAALFFASSSSSGRRARAADFGFRRARPLVAVSAFVLAVLGYYGVTTIYGLLFHLKGTDKLPNELGVSHSTAALLGAGIFVCVIAPVAEEFFFRGFIFGGLRRMRVVVAGRDLGTWLAAVITAMLFGLAHFSSASPQYLIPLGFLGFVLCLVRWRTGSLYPCIALHSANNALALGVNQLSWSALGILALVVGSWLVAAAITGPLGFRTPSLR